MNQLDEKLASILNSLEEREIFVGFTEDGTFYANTWPKDSYGWCNEGFGKTLEEAITDLAEDIDNSRLT